MRAPTASARATAGSLTSVRRGSRSAASECSSEQASNPPDDYGEGWTQLTDHGKIYLSKKEKNVFVMEGTKTAGFSAVALAVAAEQRSFIEAGGFTLTAEIKVAPGEQCPDQQVFVMLDCYGMADLSSGCDFCGVHLCFDSKELKIESHRRNASVQTLFAQPSCALLRPQAYSSLTIGVSNGALALTLSGVSIISNVPLGRPRAGGAGVPSVGLAVYGRTRVYVKRFRVGPAPVQQAQDSGCQQMAPTAGPSPNNARRSSSGSGGPSQTPLAGYGPAVSGGSGGSNYFAAEEMELANAIERDIVCEDLNVKFEDIGGLEDAKRAINEAMVLPLLMPEFFTGLRRPWKGVLLFGPPGTGKTMMAKAVASCTDNVTFFNCSSATLTSKWRGESEKLLRALFVAARARVPAILFFDEIDSLLSHRGNSAEHEASRRFKSEFLIHMDGLLSEARPEGDTVPGHLLVLATSNSPWDLDEALRRRLEKRIYIPLPEEAPRTRMFESHLKDIKLTEDVDFSALASRSSGYSGADIQLICRDASMNPMRRMVDGLSPTELLQLRDEGRLTPGELLVNMADFNAALKNVQPSVSRGDTQKYLDWAQEFGSK